MLFAQISCSLACLGFFHTTCPSVMVWFIWKSCGCGLQQLYLTFCFSKGVDINLTICVQSHLFFSEWLPVQSGLRKCEETGLIQSQRNFSTGLLLLWLLSHFFTVLPGQKWLCLSLWFCSYPNGCRAVGIPVVCASFPSCCFCRILISFGCVNLKATRAAPSRLHSLCLVAVISIESTLWTK